MDDNAPQKALTWDDLANLYKEKTGRTARIRPMDEILKWATKHPDFYVDNDGYLYHRGFDK